MLTFHLNLEIEDAPQLGKGRDLKCSVPRKTEKWL